jgi:hypothetical protein
MATYRAIQQSECGRQVWRIERTSDGRPVESLPESFESATEAALQLALLQGLRDEIKLF